MRPFRAVPAAALVLLSAVPLAAGPYDASQSRRLTEKEARKILESWRGEYQARAESESDPDARDAHLQAARRMDKVLATLSRAPAQRRESIIRAVQRVHDLAWRIENSRDPAERQRLCDQFWKALREIAGSDPAGPDLASGMSQRLRDEGVGGPSSQNPSGGTGSSGAQPSGDGGKSLGFTRQLAQTLPNDAGARAQYAGQLLRAGAPAEAAREAREAVRLDPSNAMAHSVLSRSAYHLGDYAQAEESARKAVELDPTRAEAAAVLKLTPGRASPASWDGRAEDLKASAAEGRPVPPAAPQTPPASHAPEEPGAFQAQEAVPGDSVWPAGSLDAALVRRFKKDASAAPKGRAVAFDADAERFLAGGDYTGTMAAAQRALEFDPDDELARYYMIMSLIRQSRLKEALQEADAALARGPKSTRWLAVRARVLCMLRRYAEALEDADAALRLESEDAEALVVRAWALDGLGRRDEALESLRRAATLEPRHRELYQRASLLGPGGIVRLLGGEPASPAPARSPASGPEASGGGGISRGFIFLFVLFDLALLIGGWLFLRGREANPWVRPQG